MTISQSLAYYILPIGSTLLFGAGLVSWQRSSRFWSGQFVAPRPWETLAILVGTAGLVGYIAFVAPYDSMALKVVTALAIIQPAAAIVWLTRLLRPGRRTEPDTDEPLEVEVPASSGKETKQ